MGRKIIFNNSIKYIDSANIKLTSPALNFGLGLFETVLYHNGKLFFYNDHLKRLSSSCSELNIPVFDADLAAEDKIMTLISLNGMTGRTLRVKLLYAPLSDTGRWDIVVRISEYSIPEEPFRAVTDLRLRDDYFSRHKTASYMRNFLSALSKEHNEETLFVNCRGEITEGARSNLLCLKDGKIYSAGKNGNYLQGIMQEQLKADCANFGVEAVELQGGFSREFVGNAEEVILTNSLIISANVSCLEFGGEVFNYGGSFAKKIKEFYMK